jgi:hypothetical protein
MVRRLRSLKLVVGWNLKQRGIGLGAGQVLRFSCGYSVARIARCRVAK